MKQKKLVLINPVNEEIQMISSNLFFKHPPVPFSILKSLTTADWKIKITNISRNSGSVIFKIIYDQS